jgi:16S rRNA (uracil1498-N3)-methyltransferase
MPHFYIPPEQIHDKTFRITGEDVHYLVTVRRYNIGDSIKIFDGKGSTMLGRIDSVSKEEIVGTIVKSNETSGPRARLNIYTAVPKGERLDWLVEKAAELGVSKITPLITDRSTIRELSEAKYERLQRLSKAASQQCGRPELLEIGKPQPLSAALNDVSDSALNLIPWEAEESKTLKDVYKGNTGAKEINIFIGPEGGFSSGEIELAKKYKFVPITLGERILRVETAGLLSTILVLELFGDYERK